MEEHPKDDHRFDASQYAFFGGEVSQEVELGGLDEEDDVALGGALEEEGGALLGLSEKDEVEALDNVSHLDDVSADISEISRSYMNLGLNEPESDHDAHSWYGNHQRQFMQDAHGMHSANFLSQRHWAGESEYPQSPQSPFAMSGPYPKMRPQGPTPIQSSQQHVAVSHGHLPQNFRPYGPATPRTVPVGSPVPQFLQYGGSPGLSPPTLQGQWMGPSNMQLGVSGGLMHGSVHQQMTQQQSILPAQGLMQRQLGHSRINSANLQQAMFNSLPSAPAMLQKPNEHHHYNTSDGRDFRHEMQQRNRLPGHAYQQGPFDSANLPTRSNSRQQFRSKYMSAEEIESIAKIQLAATHSTDLYIDDYYHQAAQAKLAGGQRRHFHFAPSHLRDSPSHRRAPAMQPTFVPVDGLGRVPFSSIRRPRPLLEVEDYSGQAEGCSEALSLKMSERPLEQEPMLAARIAIEDGLCLLLDVDDIDRFLSANQLPDGGAQLRRQRQLMLEGLAASLQLISPLTSRGSGDASKNEHFLGAETQDDVVFLRLVSLPKGRKLVYRYLQLLPLGSELTQIVCMAVFRHLRFLFGAAQTEPGAIGATAELASTVADCASRMDLNAISDCLAAVVVSSEQPPLRPFGSTAGDGASLILRSALDRATHLLTDPGVTFPLQDRAVWQATFDRFFLLLYRYCTTKFDSILHSVAMSSPPGRTMAITAAAAEEVTARFYSKIDCFGSFRWAWESFCCRSSRLKSYRNILGLAIFHIGHICLSSHG
ncbi:hypothetical protein GOP47_0015873 [Adiantum capillus-veneris]|uniref:Topoisomerase II-associated protein PAT1 n=1 Tax=Adiantum capillus-veneris TaxID=13818 RepID=A0A9D4UKT3_ADICA|nr:hypothetical protein GOP47_0015873 [Adiantum capillus-veneris]